MEEKEKTVLGFTGADLGALLVAGNRGDAGCFLVRSRKPVARTVSVFPPHWHMWEFSRIPDEHKPGWDHGPFACAVLKCARCKKEIIKGGYWWNYGNSHWANEGWHTCGWEGHPGVKKRPSFLLFIAIACAIAVALAWTTGEASILLLCGSLLSAYIATALSVRFLPDAFGLLPRVKVKQVEWPLVRSLLDT